MINSFAIQGYKVFQNLEIDHLARLNLFVGENNAGKSCLLEAVRLWTANGSLPIIRELVHARDGDWEEASVRRRPLRSEFSGTSVLSERSSEDPVRFLFNNFTYKDERSAAIELGPLDGQQTVRISLGQYQLARAEDGTERRVRVSDQLNFDSIDPDSEWMLEIDAAGKNRTIRLQSLWRRPNFPFGSSSDESTIRPITSVGTNGLSSREAAFLWDQVSLLPEQKKVLDCLKLIDSSIEGLTLIGDSDESSARDRIPVISLRGRQGRFPLKTMGDGLTRLFHIALAMVNAQNGTVLIDEFENGIYWEVQHQLWPLIFEMAREFDVQVFATSHSKDCLASFIEAASQFEGLAAVFRVERSETGTRVLPLPEINVADALIAQVEIR